MINKVKRKITKFTEWSLYLLEGLEGLEDCPTKRFSIKLCSCENGDNWIKCNKLYYRGEI